MSTKKYLSLERLTEYDELIKGVVNDGDAQSLSDAKTYTDTEITKITSGTTIVPKADVSNSATTSLDAEKLGGQLPSYYAKASDIPTGALANKNSVSESDLDNALAEKVNAASEGNHSHSNKTVLDGITSAKVSSWDSAEQNANTYTDTVASGKADANHNHDSAYDSKGSADSALASAKTYADTVGATVKNDLLNGAGTAYDTLKELGDLIDDNQDAIEALETVAAGKADAEHTHDIADVTGLQSALDGKAASSHGTHVTYSTDAPKMDGTASAGTASTVSRSDHVHPTDTSRASQADLDALENVVAGKADSSHSHTITAEASDDDVVVLSGTNGSNKVSYTASHATSGVTEGTYKSVTVNKYGHVTGGTNPTTLEGYGITDAASKTHNHAISDITNLQTTLNNASSAISANTSSINTHTDRITALETKVGDGFEAITSEEIQALFA